MSTVTHEPSWIPESTDQTAFQFERFWTQGGFAFEYTHQQHITDLLIQIQTQEKFRREFNGKIPVDVAAWDTDWSTKENAPKPFRTISDHLLRSKMLSEYQRIYGNFSFVKHMFHSTPRDYINDYHSHTLDGSHFHIFLYFCPELRDFADGGITEIGEVLDKESVLFDPEGFYKRPPKGFFTHQSYIPRTGLGLVVNNIHPYFRHRVTRVLSARPRYTLMLAFGYQDNCTMDKGFLHI